MKKICLMIALSISFLAGAHAAQTSSEKQATSNEYRAAIAETAKKYDMSLKEFEQSVQQYLRERNGQANELKRLDSYPEIQTYMNLDSDAVVDPELERRVVEIMENQYTELARYYGIEKADLWAFLSDMGDIFPVEDTKS